MTERHPDSPRETRAEDEMSEATRPQMDELGNANLDEEPGPDDLQELGDDSSPGQNSDWLPQ
jgi:hypothetical protein